MRLAASLMQILHALVASTVQSCQFCASMLREQLFKLKNEDAI
jgi:AhpD family alkylhydroperoxidase